MKINLLIGATAIIMVPSLASAEQASLKNEKAPRVSAHSSAAHHNTHQTSSSSAKNQKIDDSTTDQGRNPEDNGDEVFRPNNGGATGINEND